MILRKLKDLLGRDSWVDLADIVTMQRFHDDCPYGFTELLLTNHHVVRVQERPDHIAALKEHGR